MKKNSSVNTCFKGLSSHFRTSVGTAQTCTSQLGLLTIPSLKEGGGTHGYRTISLVFSHLFQPIICNSSLVSRGVRREIRGCKWKILRGGNWRYTDIFLDGSVVYFGYFKVTCLPTHNLAPMVLSSKPNKSIGSPDELWETCIKVCHWDLGRRDRHCLCLSLGRNFRRNATYLEICIFVTLLTLFSLFFYIT